MHTITTDSVADRAPQGKNVAPLDPRIEVAYLRLAREIFGRYSFLSDRITAQIDSCLSAYADSKHGR